MLMRKNLVVQLSASGRQLRVQIEPGVCVADLKEKLGLQGYTIRRLDNQQTLDDSQAVYPAIRDGETLTAIQEAVVGAGSGPTFLGTLAAFSEWMRGRRPQGGEEAGPAPPPAVEDSPPVNVVRWDPSVTTHATGEAAEAATPPSSDWAVPQAEEVTVITGGSKPLWEQKGWTVSPRGYRGHFRTGRGSWRGVAVRNGKETFAFYIENPPEAALRGPHGQCFRAKGPKAYHVHIKPASRDIGAGILAIERVLEESVS
jgi:hypothetical protein